MLPVNSHQEAYIVHEKKAFQSVHIFIFVLHQLVILIHSELITTQFDVYHQEDKLFVLNQVVIAHHCVFDAA